jgi:hypothetical protein
VSGLVVEQLISDDVSEGLDNIQFLVSFSGDDFEVQEEFVDSLFGLVELGFSGLDIIVGLGDFPLGSS